MAERRMISKKITDTDAFLTMKASTQALYFHFIQNADDDGFVSNPLSLIRKIGVTKADYNALADKRFIIKFDSGVCVIKHWKIHNYIQSDRYIPTTYIKEMAQLEVEENKAYTTKKSHILEENKAMDTTCIQNVSNMDTQVSIGKDRLDYNNIYNNAPVCEGKHKYGEFKNVMLTDKEYDKLTQDFGEEKTLQAIKFFDEYIEEKGYKSKSHNLAMRRWVFKALEDKGTKPYKPQKSNMWDNMNEVFNG